MEQIHIFDHIENDMPVVTENEENVGKVEVIQYGEGGSDVELPEIDTIIENLGAGLRGDTKYPDEVYEKLYLEGFIRIERGLSPDAFALPSQISNVTEGKVYLNTTVEDLLKE